MIDRAMLERACLVVEQLQEWIEDRDDLSTTPQASLECSGGRMAELRIRIGDVIVWGSGTFGADYLTFASCRDVWLEEIECFRPFLEASNDQ